MCSLKSLNCFRKVYSTSVCFFLVSFFCIKLMHDSFRYRGKIVCLKISLSIFSIVYLPG